MKLEPIINLLDKADGPYVHYSKAKLTAEIRRELTEILAEDRVFFLDGAKMNTWLTCVQVILKECQVKSQRSIGPMELTWLLEEIIDGCGEPKNRPANLLLVVENAEKILVDEKGVSSKRYKFPDLCSSLAAAGKHAGEAWEGGVGYNVVFVFDPKNKKIDVGSANHLKL